jgi:hypothetical protein
MLAITVLCIAAVGTALVVRVTSAARDPLAAQRTSFRNAVDRREAR